MIPVDEVRRAVLSACDLLRPVDVVPWEAVGQVLARPVTATVALPSFANSAMDGYALRSADTLSPPARLRVVGTTMAGDPQGGPVGKGEAARVMTGAVLPSGADAVCMVEHVRTEENGAFVLVTETLRHGSNVRRAGEEILPGEEVFGRGTCLGPPHVGVLASIGTEKLVVYPRPVVGVLSTGDELAIGDDRLGPGKVRDANRPALLARLSSDGFGIADLGTVADDLDALVEHLESGASGTDALITSGGVSVGDRDLMRAALERLCGPQALSVQVAVKPARPFAFGTVGTTGVPVFGLPGSPGAALVSYELFVRPALRRMAGHAVLERPQVTAVVDEDLTSTPDGRLHLSPVVVRIGAEGELRARPCGGRGSHTLRTMAEANALAMLPDGEGVAAGRRARVLLLDTDSLH